MIQWSRPGMIGRETQLDEIPTKLTAIGIVREGKDEQAVIGFDDGRLALWDLGIDTSEIWRIDGHADRAITQIILSQDGRRMASADEDGHVRIWDRPDGLAYGGYDPPVPDPIWIDYSPRASAYIAYATQSGELGVLGGFLGTAFDIRQEVGKEITAFALHPDGFEGFFGDTGGVLEWWHQGQCIPSLETPGMLWRVHCMRGTTADTTDLVWMRTYQFGDTTWNWTTQDTLRVFVDPDSIIPRSGDPDLATSGPHNGVPYFYSLTKYRLVFYDGQEWLVLDNSPQAKHKGFYRLGPDEDPAGLVPRVDATVTNPLLRNVYVVPDPYVENEASSHFSQMGAGHVRFFHLPEVATVRLYTLSGDLVRTLEHRQSSGGETGGSLVWDLKNGAQEDVFSGVYLYAVDTPSGETMTGYCTIVR